MKISAIIAALCIVFFTGTAEARQRHKVIIAHPDCNRSGPNSMPCEGVSPSPRGERIASSGFGTAQKVYTRKEISYKANKTGYKSRVSAAKEITPNYGAPSPSIGYSLGKPLRYIAGRLVCAINIGSALAERGIKGTGSALAKSYDSWGRPSGPQVGAVAVTDRKGGGHVALVSRVEGSRIWVWNATGGRHGWHEIEYTNRHARYRVAG